MREETQRTALLYGEKAVDSLKDKSVLLFGVGGVGGAVTEALARAGVGKITVVDADTVSVSNRNRQLIATANTVGMAKVDAADRRIHEIFPECCVTKYQDFVLPETVGKYDFKAYDYVVDAIDTVSAKIAIIEEAKAAGVPVISAMGAGNKKDASRFCVADISETKVCPLCRVVRTELRKRGIEGVPVVYSEEEPTAPDKEVAAKMTANGERLPPASSPVCPPVAGYILAGRVLEDLMK